jgi:zinc transport system ATP-binding protein
MPRLTFIASRNHPAHAYDHSLKSEYHDNHQKGKVFLMGKMTAEAGRLGVESVLEVRNLSVRFGKVQIFEDLSFSVRRGTTLAIIGPNGSGKTMLFRALLGAVPVKGTFRWASGVRIGYVPQKLDIARDVPITGFDFLHARAALARTSKEAIAQSLASVGLSSKLVHEPIGNFSGGQFQRLLVAFALMSSPNVLLMDEPAAGVDEAGRQFLAALVDRLQREQDLTVLQISHDLTEVTQRATTVLVLSREHIQMGAPREVLTQDLLNKIYGVPVAFQRR